MVSQVFCFHPISILSIKGVSTGLTTIKNKRIGLPASSKAGIVGFLILQNLSEIFKGILGHLSQMRKRSTFGCTILQVRLSIIQTGCQASQMMEDLVIVPE